MDEKEYNYFQHIIGVYQWLIVVGRFDLEYSVSSLSRFLAEAQKGRLDMDRKIFGYFKKYPKRGYVINLQPLTVYANCEKFQMKYGFGNQYAYFSEDIDENFTEPLLDEFNIHVFVDSNHGHDKVTGRSIAGLFSVVVSTPTTWS